MKRQFTILLFFVYAVCGYAQDTGWKQDTNDYHLSPDRLHLVEQFTTHKSTIFSHLSDRASRQLENDLNQDTFEKLDSVRVKEWDYSKQGLADYVKYYTYNEEGRNILVEKFLKTANGLEKADKLEYTYDEDGYDSLEIFYQWDAGQELWVGHSKEEKSYDKDGNNVLFTYYSWNNGEWEGGSKQEWNYNEMGKIDLEVSYKWDIENDGWVGKSKQVYEYDEDGNQTLYISFNWNNEKNDWEEYSKYETELNENGYLTLSASYDWDSVKNDWVKKIKNEYEFDEQGNEVLALSYDAFEDDWYLSRKVELNYDSLLTLEEKNIPNSLVIYMFSGTDSSWVYQYEYRTTIEYKGDTVVMDKTHTTDHWSTQQDITRNKYLFDSLGNKTFDESYYWTEPYRNHKNISDYNDQGVEVMHVEYYWDSYFQEWALNYSWEREYDEKGREISYVVYTWETDQSNWRLFEEFTYFYNTYFEAIKEISDQTVTFGETLTLSVFDYFKLTDNRTLIYEVATKNTNVLSVSVKDNQILINSLENTEGTDSVTLTIHLTMKDSVVTGFRVNTLEGEEVEETTLGLESPAINAVYPVPAQSRLHIREGLFNAGSQWQIIDTSGKVLENGQVTNGPIKLEKYQTGIYLINIVDGQQVKTYRFMKE